MATPDYIHETSEKVHAPGDTHMIDDENLKPGSIEESGEVFQKPQYRALGW
jgi:hypothetical protein